MQDLIDPVGLLTYRGGIPARRWSLIPEVLKLDVDNFVHETNDATATPNPNVTNKNGSVVCYTLIIYYRLVICKIITVQMARTFIRLRSIFEM